MKRILALLLAMLMMTGVLAGCGSGEEVVSTEPSTAPSESTGGDTTTTAPSYEVPIEETDDIAYDLPLVDDLYTFEYWIPNSSAFEDFSTYADNTFYQWMEAQTNVHIEFHHPTSGSEREAFQTMILSGDYPDFIQAIKNYYSGGVDKAIADGVLLALNDHIDKMPNYKEIVYSTEETFIQAVSDEGSLWGIHHIVDRPQSAWIGLGIREDWLEKAGMTVADVETIDGLKAAAVAFADYTYDDQGPVHLSSGGLQMGAGLNGSWNVTSVTWNNSGIMNVDGVATYSPLQEGFKGYVGTMAEWYAEGLINKNYVADAAYAVPQDRWVNSEVGIGEFIYTMSEMYAASAAVSDLAPDPDFHLVAIATPKLNAEDDWGTDYHVRNTQGKIRPVNSMGISTQCSNIDLACAYWNHAWSEEGKIASNWGQIEGEYGDTEAHYYIDETDANGDGHTYCYQPWTMEKYGNVSSVQVKFAVHNGPTYSIWSREFCTLSAEQIEFTYTWDTVGNDWMWPEGVTLTSDEGNAASSILTVCNTAVNEWVAAVITGAKSVDTYETELVPTLKSNGIEGALTYYQAALSRYNQRIEYMEK